MSFVSRHSEDLIPVRVLETLPIDTLRRSRGLPSEVIYLNLVLETLTINVFTYFVPQWIWIINIFMILSWLVEMGKWPPSCCMWICFCKQCQCILMASLCNSNAVLNDLILNFVYKEYVWGLRFKLINKYGDGGESKHCRCCRSHWILPLMSTSIPFKISYSADSSCGIGAWWDLTMNCTW